MQTLQRKITGILDRKINCTYMLLIAKKKLAVVPSANLNLAFFPWSSRLGNRQPIMHRRMVCCLMKQNGTKSQRWPFQFIESCYVCVDCMVIG
jgi:hypothetical protein